MIREARPEDAAAIARIHVDSWRSTYKGIVPDEHLAGLSYERREQGWREALSNPDNRSFVYVAEDEAGNVVGFASGGPEREGHPDYKGELYAIYLFAQFQRRGLGRQLTQAVARRLLKAGISSMLVWVLADNPGRAFYEALGGTYLSEKKITIGEKELVEVAYGWRDIRVL
jgi:ribosomal protein S18 acetylase RimI-like enzyme